MSFSGRLAACLVSLLFAAAVSRLARDNRLQATSAAWWLCGAGLMLALGAAPELLSAPATALGLEGPPSLPIAVAGAFLVLRGLFVDVSRTRSELCLRRLAHSHVHLELRFRELEQALAAHGVALPGQEIAAGSPEGARGQTPSC